ncbi:NADH dehydrogenase [ubiquinone] 1 beta subcomplex subunit 2, mitochondrial [Amyelois transitella]|uniref:NADH dehydrogenase [ubiquinone] 1 beta subcomplex subunit 2, mitochondrial n=1 Tax=Amyelois transitella TaxID=680683 RepID=UPI00067C9DC5|nr:NADH dehydrogenase [ubiquinone] 1 beta subcomplex subunit 2, mitochondrial [Amyelois transitella]
MITKNLVSRALLIRTLKNIGENAKQTKRNAGHGVWSYRVPPPLPSKRAIIASNIMGGLCWYWILYHLATEPEHVFGEWPYVDPIEYTDEELGIPPDSVGPLK